MKESGLTGSRIRETRLLAGLRQAELAKNIGISPAYLNLIEHNKRRIGGKLLLDISRELDVDPSNLSEGADLVLLEALSDAAARFSEIGAEKARVEELAGRFPGFAALVVAMLRKTDQLEQAVEELSDRLTHDPQLADSLHEILSVATAIHSTSAILADSKKIDVDWQDRFHRNLYEDSQRLSNSAQALVAYLASSDDETEREPTLPQAELENWLSSRDFHIQALEGEYPVSVDELLQIEPSLTSSATTKSLSKTYLERYRSDALKVPQHRLVQALGSQGFDPIAIARKFDCDLATLLRRVACLKTPENSLPVGLVVCDSSGTLTFRKPIDGFSLPCFGATCPLLPLYQALSRPLSPIRQLVEHSGHQKPRFMAFAISQPTVTPDFSMPQLFEATMLIIPEDKTAYENEQVALPIGSACRTCPRERCLARREPSILTDGF